MRSPKLFTLGAIYDGTATLLEAVVDGDYDQKLAQAFDFWDCVADNVSEWGRVKDGDLKPVELRQEYINTHAVVLWALGAVWAAPSCQRTRRVEGFRGPEDH